MKFRFPIVIIDEDFRSENTSGLGIRALAQAIETEAGPSGPAFFAPIFLAATGGRGHGDAGNAA